MGVTQLEKAYALVQDLDSLRSNYNIRSFDSKSSASRTLLSQFNKSSTQTLSHRNNIKGKSLERDNKNKGLELLKISSTIKCYKCQGYKHLATSCPSLIKITIIDGIPTKVTESL